MRDDSQKWSTQTFDPNVYSSETLVIKQIQPNRQIIISGVRARENTKLALIAWSGFAPAHDYALVLRRDRIIEINGPARSDGWDEQTGLAISDVTDGYAVAHLDGPDAMPLLMRSTEISINQPSASAARLCFGFSALVYAREGESSFAAHVSRPFAQSFRQALISPLPFA